MAKLKPDQLARQKAALAKHHEDGKKGLANTSAGSVKPSKSLANMKVKLSQLLPECTNVIKQTVTGGLVPYRDVWKGTEQELVEILDKDPSASVEDFDIQVGIDSERQPIFKSIKVLVTYAPPDKNRIETAKWTFAKEADLRKAMDDGQIKKIDLALKKQLAEDKGAIPKENAQEIVKEEFEKKGLKALTVSSTPPAKVIYPTDEEIDEEQYEEDEDE